MARRRGIFDFDSLTPRLQRLLPQLDAAVGEIFDAMALQAESQMRAQATWTDRTGNARNGLMADHVAETMVRHTLVLYHSMPYGVYLEVRWSGRYGVIGPVMLETADHLNQLLALAFARVMRG